jgi:hypothetical protein
VADDDQAGLEWEVRRLYDRYGNYCPDEPARSLGCGAEDE